MLCLWLASKPPQKIGLAARLEKRRLEADEAVQRRALSAERRCHSMSGDLSRSLDVVYMLLMYCRSRHVA